MVLSPNSGGKRYKVNKADFSARLPKLNLASPDLKHAGRRVQNWIRQGVAILVTPFAELKIQPVDYWYFNQPHLHWGCTKKYRFNEGKTSQVVGNPADKPILDSQHARISIPPTSGGNRKFRYRPGVTNRYAIDQQAQN